MLPKILLTVALALIVWYGYQYVTRLQRIAAAAKRGQPVRESKRPQVSEVEDTVRCPACGTYVPARQAGHCGRSDCPYPPQSAS